MPFPLCLYKKNNSSTKIDNSVTINLKTQKDAVDLTYQSKTKK